MAKRQEGLSEEQQRMRRESREKVERLVSAKDAEFQGFINVTLSDEEKREFVEWVETIDLGALLASMLDEGNVLSVKQDKKGKGYASAITSRWAGSVNAGWCVNMRAGDPTTAIQRVVFVVSVILGMDWQQSNLLRGENDW